MSKENDIDKLLQEEEERDARRRNALAALLDEQREKAGHVFALKAHMGITESYIASVSLSWVESNIKFAADLPLFKGKSDPNSKQVSIDKDTTEFLQQRAPDWRRQLPMSVYLAERDNHKFPALLVVCYQDWAYQPPHKSNNWGADKRAIKHSLPIVPLDSDGFFLDIADKQTLYYALDGQHRLMAIKGFRELLANRELYERDKQGKQKKYCVTLQGEESDSAVINSIVEQRRRLGKGSIDENEILKELQNRMNETIGIEIIPAVQKGETQEEAVTRLRQIFVDVNERAKLPSKGDNIMLDNSNGFRVVARRIMVSHNLLDENKTSVTQPQLPETSECYTTLQGLVEITENYLGKIEYAHWGTPLFGKKDFGYMRPPEEDIRKGIATMAEYFNALAELPSHVRFVQAIKEDRWQLRSNEPIEDDPSPMILDNVLFRPIVQSALASAIGDILEKGEIPEGEIPEKLADIVARMSKQEQRGMLQLRNAKSPWFGVLCDPVDKKMPMRRQGFYKELCQRLFFYLLHGLEEPDKEELRKDFAESRKTGKDEKENEIGTNMKGESVQLSEIKLPNRWE